MYMYNVTVNIENSVHDEWLEWMKQHHIPDVMRTGMFAGNRIMKLLTEIENEGTTYTFQYFFEKMDQYHKYQEVYAPKLQAEHTEKFGGKFVAFRTLLEIVE